MAIEYLSFGAGPPSLALAILNTWGQVTPKAQLIVFADTGWEKARTYELLPLYENWFAEMGWDYAHVQAKEGPLPEYIRDRSTPIPVHTDTGLGHRQCTTKWKVAVIERYLHDTYGKGTPLVAQLGLTYDMKDVIRMKQPPVKRNRNRWPLIEKKFRRDVCEEIIRAAGLPVPPWSACVGCPLQNGAQWRTLASEHPSDFNKAAAMDDLVQGRGAGLHWTRRPLRQVYSTDQGSFFAGGCDSGHCFT